jgi:hypothetical protein
MWGIRIFPGRISATLLLILCSYWPRSLQKTAIAVLWNRSRQNHACTSFIIMFLCCWIWGSYRGDHKSVVIMGYGVLWSAGGVGLRFGGSCCLHVQGRRVNQTGNQRESNIKGRFTAFFMLVFCFAFSDPEDGGDSYLGSVGLLLFGLTALCPRRQNSSNSHITRYSMNFVMKTPWLNNIMFNYLYCSLSLLQVSQLLLRWQFWFLSLPAPNNWFLFR